MHIKLKWLLCLTLLLCLAASAAQAAPPKPEGVTLAAPDSAVLAQYTPGNRVYFGSADPAAPLEWIVLGQQDGMALLLSAQVLDRFSYDNYFAGGAYCMVLDNYFAPDEFNRICVHAAEASAQPQVLFALSQEEVQRYLPNAADRAAVLRGTDQPAAWYLSTPGTEAGFMATVLADSSISASGCPSASWDDAGVRPAMWVYLSDVTDSGNGDVAGTWLASAGEGETMYFTLFPNGMMRFVQETVSGDMRSISHTFPIPYLYRDGKVYISMSAAPAFGYQDGALILEGNISLQRGGPELPVYASGDRTPYAGAWGDLAADPVSSLSFTLNADGAASVYLPNSKQLHPATWYVLEDGNVLVSLTTGGLSDVTILAEYTLHPDASAQSFTLSSGEATLTLQRKQNIGAWLYTEEEGGLVLHRWDTTIEPAPEWLVIPAALSGKPVLRVADRALAGLPIRYLTVEGPITLGREAFAGCTTLESAALPDGLVMGEGLFRNCTALRSVTLPGGVASYPDGVLAGCTALTELTLPEGLTAFSYKLIEGCTGLQHVYLPRSLASVDGGKDLHGARDYLDAESTAAVFHVWRGSWAEMWASGDDFDPYTEYQYARRFSYRVDPLIPGVLKKAEYLSGTGSYALLYEDGTVSSTSPFLDVSAWQNVVDIIADVKVVRTYAEDRYWDNPIQSSLTVSEYLVGLTADGHVLMTGSIPAGGEAALSWEHVAKISAGGGYIAGVTTDGRLLMAGEHVTLDTSRFQEVMDVLCLGQDRVWVIQAADSATDAWRAGLSSGTNFAAYITADGKLDVRYQPYFSNVSFDGWDNIVQARGGRGVLAVLRADGSVAFYNETDTWLGVEGWNDIVAIDLLEDHTSTYSTVTLLGYRRDGTVVATGAHAHLFNGLFTHNKAPAVLMTPVPWHTATPSPSPTPEPTPVPVETPTPMPVATPDRSKKRVSLVPDCYSAQNVNRQGYYRSEPLTDGLYTYVVLTENEAILCGYEGDASSAVIPETVGGLPVVCIDSDFYHNDWPYSINIPVHLRYIDGICLQHIDSVAIDPANQYFYADETGLYTHDRKELLHFYGAEPYTDETVAYTPPQELCALGEYAFQNWDRMIFDVPDTHPHLKLIDGSLYTKDGSVLLYANPFSTVYEAPDTVRDIHEEAFSSKSISHIVLNEGLEELHSVFIPSHYDSDPVTLYIPSTLVYLDRIDYTENWKHFEVHPDNPSYKAVDGILYTPDLRTMMRYPSYKEGHAYTVPEHVEVLGSNAFADACYLETVILPEHVKKADYYAFHRCDKLQHVYIANPELELKDCFDRNARPVIHAPEGSTAQAMAAEEGLTFEAWNPADGVVVREPQEFTWELLEDGTICVTSWLMPRGVLTIPETIDGYTVTALGEDFCQSWKYDYWQVAVRLPDTMRTLGARCLAELYLASFTMSSNLETIAPAAFENTSFAQPLTIPASLVNFDMTAFSGAYVPSFEVAADNPAFASRDGVLFTRDMKTLLCYNQASRSESYAVPEGVEVIADRAFNGQYNLRHITLPSTLKTLGSFALASVGLQGALQLPAGLESLETSTFLNSAMSAFEVDSANQHFCAIDGVLFTKDGATLLAYPAGSTRSSYAVPEGTLNIPAKALWSDALEHVTLPGSIRSLAKDALGSYTLRSVTIPASVTGIENGFVSFAAEDFILHVAPGSQAEARAMEDRLNCAADQ